MAKYTKFHGICLPFDGQKTGNISCEIVLELREWMGEPVTANTDNNKTFFYDTIRMPYR